MHRLKVALVFALLLAFPSLAAASQETKSYQANRFDVDVVVRDDGSLLVTETVEFRFLGGPFTFVFRELPADHTDGIVIQEVRLDDRNLTSGSDAGQAELSGRDPLRVTWHMEPTRNTVRTFVLIYEALGVARKSEGNDLLQWQALPDEYEYRIDRSQVTFRWPEDGRLIGRPATLAGEATAEIRPNSVSYSMSNLNPNQPLVVSLTFEGGSLIDAPPAWQAQEQKQNSLAWLWLVLSGSFLGGGSALFYWLHRRNRAKIVGSQRPAYAPPDATPPGLAGALVRGTETPNWSQALGTMFDLASREVLAIDEIPGEGWFKSRDFLVKITGPNAEMRPHEQALMSMLFDDKGESADQVKMSALKGLSTRRWQRYVKAVKREVGEAGWMSDQKKRIRRRMTALGVAIFFAGLGSLFALPRLSQDFGGWPGFVSGSLILLGLVGFVFGLSQPTLSQSSAELSHEWWRFREYLKQVVKGVDSLADPELFEKYLAYAAAFGLLTGWAKVFEREAWTELPAYVRVAPGSSNGNAAIFVALASSSSSAGTAASTSSGAGAAGAGAAGGGASGAG